MENKTNKNELEENLNKTFTDIKNAYNKNRYSSLAEIKAWAPNLIPKCAQK